MTNAAATTAPKVLATFPAFVYVEAPGMKVSHGMEAAIHISGDRFANVRFGSVAGYAAQYNEDATEAVERAERLGHKKFWINLQAAVLTAETRAQQVVLTFRVGDVVEFEGQRLEIVPAMNGNYHLTPVA